MNNHSKDNQWETCRHAMIMRAKYQSPKNEEKEITGSACKIPDNNWIGGPKCFKETCAEYLGKVNSESRI